MRISLLDIDDEGASFKYDNSEKELVDSFRDLINENSFIVNFRITPLGNAFQLVGVFNSSLSDQCSLCGWDINLPVSFKINEILMEKDEYGRTDSTKQSATHIPDSSQPSVSYYEEGELNVGEFLHELIGLALPNYPKCEDRVLCDKQKAEAFERVNNTEDIGKHSPFSVLKKLKN